MNHADAEAGAGLHAAGAEAERVGDDAIADGDAVVDVAREANVGVAAAEALRLGQGDVGQALEARIHDARLRRLRDQVADQVAGIQGHAGGAEGFDKVSRFIVVFSASVAYTAGEIDVIVKSSRRIAGTSAVPGLS